MQGSIVAGRKGFGLGKIVVVELVKARIVTRTIIVDLLMNAVFLANVPNTVVLGVPVAQTAHNVVGLVNAPIAVCVLDVFLTRTVPVDKSAV